MRIAIVTDQYLPQLGGVPDSIVTVTKGLRKLGHTVRIYAPHLPGSLSDSDVERLPTVTFQGGMGALVSPFGLHKRLSEWRPDVVHVHSVGIAAFAGMRAARALHIPAVATCHGSMADYLYHLHLDIWPIPYLVKRAEGWYFNHASLVTAPAQKPLDGIIEHGARPAHMHVISNPIDCDLFHALEYRAAIKKKLGIGPRAVLLFGRIAQEKNLELAIEILANVSKKCDVQIVVLGDGPYRPQLEEKLRELNLTDRTHMLGVLRGETLVEAVNACDVMLITSLVEAQPMTILQAMQCGLPVVGPRAGGVPECIEDDVTGYLLEPDDREGFTKSMLKLLGNENLRKNFGDAAQKRVAAYAPERIAQLFVDAYQRTIAIMKSH